MAKETVKKYKKYKLLDYFGVIFLSLFLFFVWHLYKGPIAVPFLKPYIIQALNGSEDYQVSLDSVNIELVRSIQPIKIIANNIVYKKADDSFVINAPRTSVSFSLRALLRGIIAPSAIEVDSPNIYAFTSYGIEAGKTNSKFDVVVNTTGFAAGETYILPIVIDSDALSEGYAVGTDLIYLKIEMESDDKAE